MNKFTTVIITKPTFFDGEAEAICRYVEEGRLVHVRKPAASMKEMETLLDMLPKDVHTRLVLHDFYELAEKYGIYGVHLNSRNPKAPAGWEGSISRSCHSLEEVRSWKHKMNYVSLSPIYDSIAKKGYMSAFSKEMLAEAVKDGTIDEKVYALGGVTFRKLQEVEQIGFGGAMILGDAWK